jgi:hypothetical protein
MQIIREMQANRILYNTQWAGFISFGEHNIELVRFEVLIAVTMKCIFFWELVLCSLIEVY